MKYKKIWFVSDFFFLHERSEFLKLRSDFSQKKKTTIPFEKMRCGGLFLAVLARHDLSCISALFCTRTRKFSFDLSCSLYKRKNIKN